MLALTSRSWAFCPRVYGGYTSCEHYALLCTYFVDSQAVLLVYYILSIVYYSGDAQLARRPQDLSRNDTEITPSAWGFRGRGLMGYRPLSPPIINFWDLSSWLKVPYNIY